MVGTLGGVEGQTWLDPQGLLSVQLGVGEHVTRRETHL